jgi:AcrR family transcriptional regulator
MKAAPRKKAAISKPTDSAQLDQLAWLKAAAIAIAEDGFNGTRILPLSKRLGVTRGSFYWHFADHAAFVRAFIVHWQEQQLRAVAAYKHQTSDPVNAYARLLDVVLTDTGPELKRLKVEFALRGYARRDAFAAAAVTAVDFARTGLFMPIVRDIADSPNEAESFAHLLMVQLSGAQHAIAGPNCDANVLAGMKRAMLKSLEAMHALRAMNLDQNLEKSALRFSRNA